MSSPAATSRKPTQDNDDDMFSPTSAAALALSTLHHFGAERDNRRPMSALRGTRLFNGNNTTSNSSNNNNSKAGGSSAPTPYSYPSASPPSSYAPPPHPHSYHSYQDRRYSSSGGEHYNERRGSTASQPSSAPWGAPPYPPRYQAHHSRDNSSYSMESHPPSHGSTPSTTGPSPPSSRQYYPEQHSSTCTQENMYHTHPRRGSPVGFVGPSPPMSRSSSFHGPHPAERPSSDKHLARLASCATTSLVTPTPKKAKLDHLGSSSTQTTTTTPKAAPTPAYSRKKKSLGILAENFLKTYQHLPQGSTIVVDEAAVKLGVERRRIYDVVNILESICLVCKKHKNTYSWMGMDQLDAVFGRLQAQAIQEYPEDAKRFLGIRENLKKNKLLPVPLKPPRKQSKFRENKSLAKLSQEFLQVFLVGHETLSLPEASDKIQGTTSMEELIAMGSTTAQAATPNDPKEIKAAAARGLKTKIRRLYDIANVFLSVGLLKKVDSNDSSRRPNFSWSYRLTAKDLYELHRPTSQNSVDEKDAIKDLPPSSQESSSSTETERTPCSSSVPCSTTSSPTKSAVAVPVAPS